MKVLLSLVSIFLTVPVMAASTLNVPAGETYVVKVGEQRMVLSSLTIGDGATIRFAEGVSRWQLRAEEVDIGSKVLIDARGSAGVAGTNAAAPSKPQAIECKNGVPGIAGSPGQRGGNGVSLRLQLGLKTLGDLRISGDGGSGGDGSRGGDGQAAAETTKDCKKTASGGNAGAGGQAGDGGMAGDVSVAVWAVSTAINIDKAIERISVSTQAGAAGSGGSAGKPGAGSEGHYVRKRTLTGNRAWQGGGVAGADAKKGEDGRKGMAGRALVEHALMATSAVPAAAANYSAGVTKPVSSLQAASSQKPSRLMSASQRDAEIKAIKQQVTGLLRRIEALESK